MRIASLLLAAAVLLLAGCATTPSQSTTGTNTTSNDTACGSGVPVITVHQIGNGAGDPTANNTACNPLPSASQTPSNVSHSG